MIRARFFPFTKGFYTSALPFEIVLIAAVGCGLHADPPRIDHARPEAQRYLSDAREALLAEAYGQALALSDSAAEYAPEVPEIPYLQGEIYLRLKAFSKAEASYQHALALDPKFPGAWFQLGHSFYLQHQFRKALARYDRERELLEGANEEADDLGTVLLQIGRTYDQLGRFDSARAFYESALLRDSTLGDGHAWLSDLFQRQGELGQARRHAEAAFRQDPNNLDFTYRLGSLFFAGGNYKRAVPLLEAVVSRRPGHEGATYNLGRALVALGRRQEGRRYLDRIDDVHKLATEIQEAQRQVELSPRARRAWIQLGLLTYRAGYLEEAAGAFDVALSLDPSDLRLRNDVANLALERGDTTAAEAGYRRILSMDPKFAEAWFNLGVLYAHQSRMAKARNAWQRTLEINPDHETAREYLARSR